MTPKQKHVTFDLETLGNTHDAPIVQIAAVEFNLQGEILKTFSKNIELNRELQNFTPTYETIKWWFEQDVKAINSVFNSPLSVDLRTVLIDFMEWCTELSGQRKFWSHATFDPVILKNAFDKFNFVQPAFHG